MEQILLNKYIKEHPINIIILDFYKIKPFRVNHIDGIFVIQLYNNNFLKQLVLFASHHAGIYIIKIIHCFITNSSILYGFLCILFLPYAQFQIIIVIISQMHNSIQNKRKLTNQTNTKKHNPQQQKLALWKQVPTITKQGSVQTLDITSKNLKPQQDLQFKHTNSSPIVNNNKKQKHATISNFLKYMQVEMEEDSYIQKLDGDSEVISILDIKYGDSFYTQKHIKLNKSMLADKRFHLYLLITGYKQTYTTLKKTIGTFYISYLQQIKSINLMIQNLLTKYQTQISNRTIQLKNVQLQLREQNLINKEQKSKIEAKTLKLQQKLKHTQQKLKQTEVKLKQQQEQCKQLKLYNKDLNQIIMKSHKKMQDLQNKTKIIKQGQEFNIRKEVKKVQEKYQNLMDEQKKSYQLKVQNIKIKFINFLDSYGGNKDKMNMSMSLKESDSSDKFQVNTSLDLGSTLSMSILDQCYQGPNVQLKKYRKNKKQTSNYQYKKKKQEVQTSGILQSSPKSTASSRRFARTSKPQFLDSGQSKLQNSRISSHTTPLQNLLCFPDKQKQIQQSKYVKKHKKQASQNLKQYENQKNNVFSSIKSQQKQSKQSYQLNRCNYISQLNSQTNTTLLKKKYEQLLIRQPKILQSINHYQNVTSLPQKNQVLDTHNMVSKNTCQLNTITKANIQIPQITKVETLKLSRYGKQVRNNQKKSYNISNVKNKEVGGQQIGNNRSIPQMDSKLRETIA